MKLLRLTVEHATSCGGLLDKVDVDFESGASESELDEAVKTTLSPHCLIGQNGSGKSQLLQLLAEIFQSAWCAHAPSEERDVADKSTLFALEYLVSPGEGSAEHVRLRRLKKGSANPAARHRCKSGRRMGAGRHRRRRLWREITVPDRRIYLRRQRNSESPILCESGWLC